MQTRLRLGQKDRAEASLAELDDQERDTGGHAQRHCGAPGHRWRSGGGDALLPPFIADSAPPGTPVWLMEVFLLEAVARDAPGDQAADGRHARHTPLPAGSSTAECLPA
jgi:hypothetical protein